MDIHKPKPWHGWREFLKEYGIIVLGVLTALALEQAVEALHWRHVVHEERAALADMSSTVYGVLLARADMQPCVDARLADIKTILDRHNAGEGLGIKGPIGRPSVSTVTLGAFDMAIADQTLSHMPLEEKSRYFGIKDAYQIFQANAGNELDAWKTLRTLDHARDFTPTDWAEIRKAYDKAADANGVLKTNLKSDSPGEWLYSFREVAKPKAEDASLRSIPWVQELCRPNAVG